MRSSKSRSRSKTNRPRTLGNVINRVFDSSGPEGKVRGTPAQLIEKYQFLANDARLSNDRVAAENFLQHAEHYTRLLAEANREMATEQEGRQQYQPQNQPNSNQSGGQNGNQSGNQNANQNSQSGGQNQNRDRPQGGDRDQRRDDRGDYRPEYRSENRPDQRSDYRADVGDEQPIVTAHDLVDHVRDNDAGLVETPEAAPRPARNDRPRYDRPRDEQRRSYPPRVDQPHQDRANRPAEQKPADAKPAEPVVLAAPKFVEKPESVAKAKAPAKPEVAKPAVAKPEPAAASPDAAKPRPPRSRAPKKPAEPASDSTSPKEVAGE